MVRSCAGKIYIITIDEVWEIWAEMSPFHIRRESPRSSTGTCGMDPTSSGAPRRMGMTSTSWRHNLGILGFSSGDPKLVSSGAKPLQR